MFSDLRRIKKLGKYLTKDKKTIYLILIVLLPVSFSGAIQPLLVGQAITILKNETTDVWLSNDCPKKVLLSQTSVVSFFRMVIA